MLSPALWREPEVSAADVVVEHAVAAEFVEDDAQVVSETDRVRRVAAVGELEGGPPDPVAAGGSEAVRVTGGRVPSIPRRSTEVGKVVPGKYPARVKPRLSTSRKNRSQWT